jgi:hypoxia up-regulated 1
VRDSPAPITLLRASTFIRLMILTACLPTHIPTNRPAALAFYSGERLLGGHADALRGRKPFNVILEPFGFLGKNTTYPSVVSTLADPTSTFSLESNARGGIDFVLPVGAINVSDPVAPRFSAEEATAMYLAHIKEFSELHTSSPVRDAVLTVPMFSTQAERIALIDAADLAGLNVLGIVEENTAAAIHYGIDRIENGTHTLLLYNMGSASTQLSLVEYSSFSEKVAGKPKLVGSARVIAKSYDASLGGRSFDSALLAYVTAAFNADSKVSSKLPASAGGDINKVPTSMVKISKAVLKAKEVLSANDNFVVNLEGVLPDVDFRVPVSRAILEKASDDAGLLTRVTNLIDDVLSQAGVNVSVIDAVELVGGGVRMPKVAAVIKEHVARLFAVAAKGLTPMKAVEPVKNNSSNATANATAASTVPSGPVVGTHMNGDESFALGSAFVAANRSSAFRVRKVGMVDATPFAVGVRLSHLDASATPSTSDTATAAASGDDSADDAAGAPAKGGKPWSKRSSLFKLYNTLDSVKRISFTSVKDLRATLFYEATTNGPALPAGTPRILSYYNVTGVEALMANATFAARGAPKVHIAFLLDENGIATVLRAEATQDIEELVPEPTPKPEKLAASNATAANATNGTAAANGTAVNGTDAVKVEKSAAANASADNATTTAANSTEAPKMKLVKRTLKFPLKVEIETAGAMTVQPMSVKDKDAVIGRLETLKKADEAKRALESAKNAIESFIFATRDVIGDEDKLAKLALVTTEAQRENITATLNEGEEWLGDEGASAPLAVLTSRLSLMKSHIAPHFQRQEEHEERPDAIKAARLAVTSWRDVVERWNGTMPQVSFGAPPPAPPPFPHNGPLPSIVR